MGRIQNRKSKVQNRGGHFHVEAKQAIEATKGGIDGTSDWQRERARWGCREGSGGLLESVRAGARWTVRGSNRAVCATAAHIPIARLRLRTLIQNDLAVIDAMEGKLEEASEVWQAILTGDSSCLTARLNFRLVEAELAWTRAAMTPMTTEGGNLPAEGEVTGLPIVQGSPEAEAEDPALNNGQSLRVFSVRCASQS